MNKFRYGKNFNKNIINANNKKNKNEVNISSLFDNKSIDDDVYATRTYQFDEVKKTIPKLNKVGYRLNSTLSLDKVNKIKKDYFYSCQELISKLSKHRKQKKIRLITRGAKIGVSLGLVALIALVFIISQVKVITLVIDGVKKTTTTNQYFPNLYMSKLAAKYDFTDYEYESSTGQKIQNGTIFTVNNAKKIVTTIKDEELNDKTYSSTLQEYLDELSVENKDILKNKYSYFSLQYQGKENETLLKDVSKLTLYLKSTTSLNKTITSKYDVKYVENDELESGKQKIKQKGQDGKYIKKYETIYLNDKKYKTIVTTTKVLSKRKDKIVERGTKVVAPTSDVWDRLASCETGGRWHLNNGNGFYGGLQFSAQTWRTAASKVGVSAPYAHLATKEDQIKAATWLQKNSGWGQWPACSTKLGLR